MAAESGHGGRTRGAAEKSDQTPRPERGISGLLPLSNRPQAAPAAHYIQQIGADTRIFKSMARSFPP